MLAPKNPLSTIVLAVFVFSPLSLCGQTYVTPAVQSPPTQYVPNLPVGSQIVDPAFPQQGQVLPANATFTSEQAIQPAQTIPLYPNGIQGIQGTPNQPQTLPGPISPVQVPWTQDLVKGVKTSHDFGSVPTSSQQECIFEFVNNSDSPLNLISVKASCGCTQPTVLTPLVEPGEMAKVKAKFDTMKFRGEKAATVTLGVNKIGSFSEYGEVQFSVKGKIRKDVVLSPGSISFDNVLASTSAQQKVLMKYAGNPLWQILRVESTNPNISAEAKEVKREGGRITYELLVKLSDSQPAGAIADELYVITNDKAVNKMPVSVGGYVKSELEAAPIRLGTVKQGSKVEKRFVIRGQQPFSISEILVGDERISFAPSEGEKKLHVLKYTLDTTEPCQIDDTITVITFDPKDPTSVMKKAVVFTAEIIASK
ncbi:DUF1573 domain-containing protein [bacterium]|nr:DUF1573 domain-containing protein [bacterium]